MKLYYIKQFYEINSLREHSHYFPLNLSKNDKDGLEEKIKYFFSCDSAEKYILKHYTEPEKFTYPFKIKDYKSWSFGSLDYKYVSFNATNSRHCIVYRIFEEEF